MKLSYQLCLLCAFLATTTAYVKREAPNEMAVTTPAQTTTTKMEMPVTVPTMPVTQPKPTSYAKSDSAEDQTTTKSTAPPTTTTTKKPTTTPKTTTTSKTTTTPEPTITTPETTTTTTETTTTPKSETTTEKVTKPTTTIFPITTPESEDSFECIASGFYAKENSCDEFFYCMHLDTEYRGRAHETTRFRREFLLSSLLTCASLMMSGFFFTSAWVIITTTTQTLAIVLYGVFSGIGASLFIWRTHVILEAVRPREDKFVRKTIHLCGEAFCQLFLSFVFTSLRTLYGTAQSIMLMSALLVNLIPISLIITRHHEGSITKRISLIQTEAGAFTPLHHQLGRYAHNGFGEPMDMTLRELQLQRAWKSPMLEHTNAAALVAAVDAHTNYMLAADEAYVTFINPNGVEIMEIIPEEDENVSVLRASTVTIDNNGRVSTDASQSVISKSQSNGLQQRVTAGNLVRIQKFSRNVTSHVWLTLVEKIAVPLQRALLVPKLYSTTLLMSTDIFSYVMCLTVLPGLAVSHHALKNAEIPFLFSLLAFPWMCFSLMTPRFGSSLSKHRFQWHVFGCICKGLALIFISFSTSKLLLSVSSVLLGFGQAVTLFLQDLVFQLSMPRAQWTAIRRPIHFTNGILILLYGTMAHWVVIRYSFQATVLLAGVLYSGSILLWHLIFIFVHHRD